MSNVTLRGGGLRRVPIKEIVVTEQMIDAGVEELRDRGYGDDLRYVVETVFRAMAYAKLDGV